MFSATMTDEVEALIQDFFLNPIKVQIAASGEPLKNIEQSSYFVPNYHTKINLLAHLLNNKEEFNKVLVNSLPIPLLKYFSLSLASTLVSNSS